MKLNTEIRSDSTKEKTFLSLCLSAPRAYVLKHILKKTDYVHTSNDSIEL
jgi:hypothetical protein